MTVFINGRMSPLPEKKKKKIVTFSKLEFWYDFNLHTGRWRYRYHGFTSSKKVTFFFSKFDLMFLHQRQDYIPNTLPAILLNPSVSYPLNSSTTTVFPFKFHWNVVVH